jgi:hypothetical protein
MSERMIWNGHVARMREIRNTRICNTSVGKPKGKEPFGRTVCEIVMSKRILK